MGACVSHDVLTDRKSQLELIDTITSIQQMVTNGQELTRSQQLEKRHVDRIARAMKRLQKFRARRGSVV